MTTPARPRTRIDVETVSLTLVGLTFAALAVVTRAPGLLLDRVFNVDETYLAAMGVTMGRGGSLYLDVVDRKPPLLPWLYSLPELLFGHIDLRLMRGLAAASVALTALGVYLLVRRLGGSAKGALAGGTLCVLATMAFPPADGLAANFELFGMLPATWAVLLAVMARDHVGRRRLVHLAAAGALIALATMVKQPFLAVLAPVTMEAWRVRPSRWRGLAAIAIGTAVTAVLTAAPFGLHSVWRWAWSDTGDYLDGKVGLIRFAGVAATVIAASLVLHLPAVMALWAGRSRLRRIDPVVGWWLFAGIVGILPGLHFLFHYLLLIVAPLSVATGLVLSSATTRARRTVLSGAALVTLVCAAAAFFPMFDQGRTHGDVAAAVKRATGPSDRILVWGALPELYWRTDRIPSGRFLSVGYLTGKWADRDGYAGDPETTAPFDSRWAIFRDDLRANPPTVVIDMTTSGLDEWGAYPTERYRFGAVLEACYDPMPTVEGMTMWKLSDADCLRRTL